MLKTLFKHEIRSIRRFLLPTLILSPVLTLFACLVGIVAMSNASPILVIPMTFLYVILIVVLGLSAVAVPILVIVRYYKNNFSDEGYLTFVLPVETWKMTLAKLLNAMLWQTVYILIVLAELFLVITVPVAITMGANIFEIAAGILIVIGGALDLLGSSASYILLAIETILLFLVSIGSQTLLYFVSITLGAVIFQKHKVLGAILAYFATNAILSFVTTMIQIIPSVALEVSAQNGALWGMHFFMIVQIVFQIALGALLWIVNDRLLTRKLNLA